MRNALETIKLLLVLVALVAVGFATVTGLLIGFFISGLAIVGLLVIFLVQDTPEDTDVS